MDTLFRNSRRKLSQGLLFWREAGAEIPVIFLHGAWNDSSEWLSVMESLAENFHCFAPDLLGFGESENPNIHHSIDLQVECLAEFLQAVKLEKVYLVGHSLGGWVAASYALKYPENVNGMVLLAPEGVEIAGQEEYCRKMRRLLNYSPFVVKLLRSLVTFTKILGWHEKITQDLQLRQDLLRYPIACQLLFKRRQAEIEAELLQKRLYSIEVPVLILQGGQDTPDALAKSQIYTQLTPKVELKMIAHAGNDLPQSCAGDIAMDIREFITESMQSKFI
ncbi:alpha/beta hydrolase [Nostoc linckia z18]|uniref:Alpha/beta hydrolase n=2 Tax=Nostoc linckia TaxID=92942 RepID=A0A9Q5Z8R7_NOSLI|nr:alpha/beta hydrolase [Nostoc linckia]PHK25899.1 alpha/beta hydrolase [Nostoc linckia z15]PHK43953.1 alpha/beta hydrolase [Nostoc linckia z16]PHJ58957.1 alpha/beta hydrolase [Nostoc linckia z1]PHJ61776.1 alpha/beta hydrolase [Nostoc linckia z3]PHJ67458.1 alpha/beta hydrolase [Nostoc linckia z2]